MTQHAKDLLKDTPTLGVDVHLNGNVKESFHMMVSARRLVIAKSSFSYVAGLLNKNNVYYANQNWWHKPLDHWSYIDTEMHHTDL